ncbi:hypothetical protein ARMSODRAFT_979211 [Armillaria solidipes]|uniref:Uncharacterized protein n=1 Tax=Armillaria solidipes TaxID=1076256 RepID=A0A2H3BIK7_9AGAR|nr:hypothetical protein ARMSODRAFT_979211 [Armillaria solidipes]
MLMAPALAVSVSSGELSMAGMQLKQNLWCGPADHSQQNDSAPSKMPPHSPLAFIGNVSNTTTYTLPLPPTLRYLSAPSTVMSDGPLQQIFFLAEEEEDAMKVLAREYMLARRKGGRALAAIRRRLWSLWIRKFPILFIQICGRYSTKDDEAYCRRKKLKCIEAYLTRLTLMIDALTLPRREEPQVLVAPDTDVQEPMPELRPSVPSLLLPVTPQKPRRSPRLKEHQQHKTLPITPTSSVTATPKTSPGTSIARSSLFTAAGPSSATSSPVRTYVDRRRSLLCSSTGTQTVLSYPIVKRRSLVKSMRTRRG